MNTNFFSLKSKFKTISDLQLQTLNVSPFLFLIVLVSGIFFAGCQQDKGVEANQKSQQANQAKGDQELLTYYTGLDPQTLHELQLARAATAKYYSDTVNAVRDHYVNLGLVLPNMGYHFMKRENVDSVFDPTKPELLVYNKNEDGSFQLSALEYAVPIVPNVPAPSGFTGLDDEWDFNTLNTGLWTLHAWVWKNNPDGVFKMMNPLVQVR